MHGVAEIYVVLDGVLEGFDASGHLHRAGPLDCTYIPAGCPHGVRNCGLDDVLLIWVHDHIERNDAAVYYPDDHDFGDVPKIDLLRFSDLEPDWSERGARIPGTMRWSVNWVGGLAGSPDPNAAIAARNARVSIGMTRAGARSCHTVNHAAGDAALSGGARRGDHRHRREARPRWAAWTGCTCRRPSRRLCATMARVPCRYCGSIARPPEHRNQQRSVPDRYPPLSRRMVRRLTPARCVRPCSSSPPWRWSLAPRCAEGEQGFADAAPS